MSFSNIMCFCYAVFIVIHESSSSIKEDTMQTSNLKFSTHWIWRNFASQKSTKTTTSLPTITNLLIATTSWPPSTTILQQTARTWQPTNDVPEGSQDPIFAAELARMDKVLQSNKQPCAMFDHEFDFRKPGRSISETKCYEYIWDTKKTEDVKRNSNKCMKMLSDFVGVVGGRDAEPGEFPHMGAIGWPTWKGDHIFLCGGSLISERFVLTVAHCRIVDQTEKRVSKRTPDVVRFGVENIANDDRQALDVNIEKFIVYEGYSPKVRYNDTALIQLATKIEFDKFVRPACLWYQDALEGIHTGIVTGWGVIDPSPHGTKTSEMLQVANVHVLKSSVCNKRLRQRRSRQWYGMKQDQLCATNLNRIGDTCHADSGGPLQTALKTGTKAPIYSVFGVTSVGFGTACGRSKFPAVYTRVSSYLTWIEHHVWGDEAQRTNEVY